MTDAQSSISGEPAGLHCGMVAVVGRANVGKSTLVNTILEEKISIVSPIAQTTRNTIRGVFTEPRGQLVFLDTPGMHKAGSDLGRVMNRMARAAVEGVDIVLLVLDASTPPREEDEGWMRRLMRDPCPCYIALNKQDQGDRYVEAYRKLWADHAAERAPGREATWFTISAQNRDGVDDLVNALFEEAPVGPYLFPADVLTDFPRKIAIADIIREKLLRNLHDELPHSVAVFVDKVHEDGETWTVRATIYVQKYSQKAIVIGKKGRLMRSTRRASERELENIYEKKVSVDLWVKVEKDWPKNFWFLKKLGYVN